MTALQNGRSTPPIDDGHCFACGPENPIGMRLHFERSGDRSVRAHAVLARQFQGWQGIAHGGIAMALLDEAMAYAAAAAGYRGMTASMSTRFRKPIPIERSIAIEGEVRWIRRHVLGMTARVLDEHGTVLVESEGSFVAKGRLTDADDYRFNREI